VMWSPNQKTNLRASNAMGDHATSFGGGGRGDVKHYS
jgi:hypothetical protein